MEKIGIGLVGLGGRAQTLLLSLGAMKEKIRIAAICDLSEERLALLSRKITKKGFETPEMFRDHRELIASPRVDALIVSTSWNSHIRIAEEAVASGKYVGIEVGGASSADELWQLVRAVEKSGVSCMMLENCCYGRNELMALNMARQGLFGELIHCECGYEHDLSGMLADAPGCERTLHCMHRNGDLYPTHGLGPIAKILRINRGNRFLTISSAASKSRGYAAAFRARGMERNFNEGDMVTSLIRCANGETILLRHCISLPRPYSRCCRVQGTKGLWSEEAGGIFIEGISRTEHLTDPAGFPYEVRHWSPVESMYEKYDHPIWRKYRKQAGGGHEGMDLLVLNAFADSVRRHIPTPIDVYDTAAWMSVTLLSEQSIALGGQPVPFPDFTNGKWISREPETPSPWALDEPCRIHSEEI